MESQKINDLKAAVETININRLTASMFGETTDDKVISAMTELNKQLEKAVILARNCTEQLYAGQMETNALGAPILAYLDIAGAAEIIEYSWVRIKLNTLLPHCRFQTPQYLSDTITRLLDNLQRQKGNLPFFKKRFLVINKHCDVKTRQAFDQDNKGWKTIPNVLKGRLFPDDDQFNRACAAIYL